MIVTLCTGSKGLSCRDSRNTFLHSFVRRDLKPENLLLMSAADDAQIKLIDFGVSEIASGLTLDGFVGSIGYIAPELFALELHGMFTQFSSVTHFLR
jgi:serine/threonine protein kinase